VIVTPKTCRAVVR